MSPIAVALVLVILAANAFFVAFEFALVASRRARLEHLAVDHAAARIALDATRNLSRHIAGVQLGVTVASLALGAAGEPAISHALESLVGSVVSADRVVKVVSFVIALLLVVFLHGVLGELVPKRIALAKAERALVLMAVPMRVFVTVLGPVIRALDATAGLVLRLVHVPKRAELSAVGSPDELLRLFQTSSRHGMIEEPQLRLLERALAFRDRAVSEVMVPRAAIVAVAATSTIAELERRMVSSGRSRLPVFDRDLDDIVGFVHAKDLLVSLEAAGDSASDAPIPRRALRRPLVIRSTRTLGDVLLTMQRARVHLAVVTDRDGRTTGLVTLEDVLEALVGQIADEHDRAGRR